MKTALATKKRVETLSFICELPLMATSVEEKALLARLEAARQVYNACLGEAKKRLALMQESRIYRKARLLPKGGDKRRDLFRQARQTHGFTDAAIQRYAVELRRSWIGDHLDVHVAQKLATRAFRAIEKMAVGKAKSVRFKGKHQMDTVEGKNNAAGIRWREDHLEWMGLNLAAILDYRDPVVRHALGCRVKYCRLVRRKIKGRNRFYVQLVCEGKPYVKPKNHLGTDSLGLDLGPSTVAAVGEKRAVLRVFCADLASKERLIRILQRKMDRQRRANNPDNYNPDGTIKKGPKKWINSNRYIATREQLAEIHRRLAAHRRSLHGQLVNELLDMGNMFNLEKLSYKAFQKMYGRSVGKRAPGMFVSELRRKAESAGGVVNEFPTGTTKLSRTCHCGEVHKKPLSERWHRCGCGVTAQRDLYSAFLAGFVDSETNLLNAGRAKEAWPGADALLRAAFERAVENQFASGRPVPSSFGATRSRSGSSAKTGAAVGTAERAKAKARDVVVQLSGCGESAGEAEVAAGRTPGL